VAITICVKVPKQKLGEVPMNPILLFPNCGGGVFVDIVPFKR